MKRNSPNLFKKLSVVMVVVLLVAIGGVFFLRKDNTPSTASQEKAASNSPAKEEAKGFNKSLHSIDEPGSLWWIVGKKRPLPEGYVPSDLVQPNVLLNSRKNTEENSLSQKATADLEALFGAAKHAGFELMLASGYRSYKQQTIYYNGLVSSLGQAEADRVSAKPGTSEHQTGLSLDIAPADRRCYITTCFAETPEGQWLAGHAHEYGFVLRYPQDKEAVTGYDFEPWHFRYVGKELAAELQKISQTLEEFFGL